jgi:hypothetical protein
MRKYRRREIVIDRDIAFGDLFRTEADEADRLDLEPRPLLLRTCPEIIESTFERVKYGFTTL